MNKVTFTVLPANGNWDLDLKTMNKIRDSFGWFGIGVTDSEEVNKSLRIRVEKDKVEAFSTFLTENSDGSTGFGRFLFMKRMAAIGPSL